MYCTNTGTGQHGDQSLRHHGHVDDDSIAAADIISRKHAGKKCCLFEQFRVCQCPAGAGDGTIVDNCRLVTAAVFHM